jgi:hypothetical protein
LYFNNHNPIVRSKFGGEALGQAAMEGSEKRRQTRFKGNLAVEFEGGTGVTRDFSGSGIFFETDYSFIAEQPMEFTLVLHNMDSERPVRVKCKGESVRVEQRGQKTVVAATIDSYTICQG